MFVEHKEAGEASPNREKLPEATPLSGAIRIGAKKLKEDHNQYLQGNGCGCAIAMAGIGYGMDDKFHGYVRLFDFVSKKSGHTIRFLYDVELMHVNGNMSALQIADWLESQGL
jgi:hypothetical protein